MPLLIMAVQGYHCASMAIIELQATNLESVLKARKARIEDWLHERQEELRTLASYPCAWDACCRGGLTKQEAGYREICSLLDYAHARNGAYESLVVYSTDWDRMGASRQSVHTDERLVSPEFRKKLAETGSPAATLPHFHEGGMIGIHMGYPVLGDTSNKVGFVVAALDLSTTVYPMLEDRTGFDKTTKAYIVSSDGRYFSHPTVKAHLLRDKAPLPESLLIGDSGHPYTYRDCMGRTVIGVSTKLPELGWVLVAEIERDEAFAWLKSLRLRAAVTGLMTLVLVAFLAFRSSRRATMPLKKLAAVARKVSEGSFETRLGKLRWREPQEVASAFNSMLDALAMANRELAQAASLAAIGELSSSIVHEMRNPLSSVKMNIKALHERVADDAMYSELALIASGQVDRLEQMLNDLLQYGKPLGLQMQQVAVSDLFDDVSIALSGLSKDSGVVLRCEDETGGGTVMVDGEQLRRAITNLVDNAIRASSVGSIVTISGTMNESDHGDEFVVRVKDVGPGLSETVLSRLFEPFFTARSDGTGLGLANVRKIVELHGGKVTGENRSGGGALFTVRLPMGGLS